MNKPGIRVLVLSVAVAFSLLHIHAVLGASGEAISAASGPALPEEGVPPSIKSVQPAPESLREDIPDWKARWELARLLSYAKRYEESLAEYDAVVQEKPDLWEAKVEMSRVMFWSGLQSGAAKMLESIPAEHTDENAKLLMADLYVARKSFEKAEPIYRAYLDSHPNDHEVVVKLADLLSWSKRYEEAIVQYKIVLKARPDDVQIRRKFAYVLIWAGKQGEAIAELRKTLK